MINTYSMFPKAKPRGTSRVSGKQYSLFLEGPVVNLLPCQGAQPDHVQVESSSCCFPGELAIFNHPRELVSFDQRHVTCSPTI